MTRAWLIDLLSSLVVATMVGGIVVLFGGPPWAALGFGFVYYLLRPLRAQEGAKSLRRFTLDFGDKPIPKRDVA